MASVIVYYGDLTDTAHLRKATLRKGASTPGMQVSLWPRMGLTDPQGGDTPRGELIPETEEEALHSGVREIGGRGNSRGVFLRSKDSEEIAAVLALAERVWGAPTGTAPEYGTEPTPVTDVPLTAALGEIGISA
jgi:hypothetical protein